MSTANETAMEVESINTDGRSIAPEGGMEQNLYPEVTDAPESTAYRSNDYPFEAVQGAQQLPMPDGRPIPPSRLFFVDFLPNLKEAGEMRKKIHPKFATFKEVFAHINNWLQTYGQFQAISFEQFSVSVDWAGQVLKQDTIYTSKELKVGNWIRGTRVWLTPKAEGNNSPPDSYGYYNAMPVSGVSKSPDDFMDLKSTAGYHNEKFQSQPIPGRIVTVLPVEHAIDSDWKPSQASSAESGDDLYFMYEEPPRILTFLRVIYAYGPPAMEEISFIDFPPRVIKLPSSGKGKPFMQPLREVLNDMCKWVANNDKVTARVLNMELSEVRYMNPVESLGKATKQKSTYDTEMSWFQGSANAEIGVIKVPRVFYVKLSGPTNEAPMALSIKLMVTPRIGYTDGEMIGAVAGRTNAWLSVTGNQVMGVKTVKFEFDAAGNKVDVEESCYLLSHKLSYFIEVVTLFLNGSYTEPDPSLLPATGKAIKSVDNSLKTGEYGKKSSTCALL